MEHSAPQQPKISVIVATYRREQALLAALDSLTAQTYKNLEILVVDDNAQPQWNGRVAQAVKEAGERSHQQIRLIVNETNQGSAASRNIGIQNATGEYISFLDDDDLYLPEKLEKQLADMLREDGDYGITDLYLYDEEGKIRDKRVRSYIEAMDPESLMRYHLLHHLTGTDTLMFKASYLRKIGGFPGIDVGDEFYLMKEAILGGGKMVYSNHCYVKAFIHTGENGGLSSGSGKIDGENALHEEKKKYFSYLSKKDIKTVTVRHHAVIAFAQLRRRAMIPFFVSAAKAFLCSPVGCVKLLKERK